MFNCVWHISSALQIVETDEFNRLLSTGDYFKTEKEAKDENDRRNLINEEKNHGGYEREGHNLYSTPPITSPDVPKTDGSKSTKRVRRRNGVYGDGCTEVSQEIGNGNGCSVSGEVSTLTNNLDNTNDTSSENHQ